MLTISLLVIVPLINLWFNLTHYRLADFFLSIGKVVLLILLVLVSSNPSEARRGLVLWCAVILSYVSFLMLGPTSIKLNEISIIALIFSALFYTVIIFWSYFTLGRSFSVLPDRREIKIHGPFRLVAHPIYFSCALLVVSYVSSYPSVKNVIFLSLFVVSLGYRGHCETELLMRDETYKKYRNDLSIRGVVALALPAFISIIVSIFFPAKLKMPVLKVSTNIPYYSLSPLRYDDWTSVFIGNHIWARLIPEQSRKNVVSVLADYKIDCAHNTDCSRKKLLGQLASLKDCSGRVVGKKQVIAELELILASKQWILPKSRLCSSDADSICIEFNAVDNIHERLQAVYFRFGWSRYQLDTPIGLIGSSNYCLASLRLKQDNLIDQSVLISRTSDTTPASIIIESESSVYDLALYKDRTRNDVKVLNASTPLAYFVLTHPHHKNTWLPWNSIESKKIISEHLRAHDYILNIEGPINAVPEGMALVHRTNTKNSFSKNAVRHFVLPSYIRDCDLLAKKLSERWINVVVSCSDLSLTTQDIVVNNKMWDGFLSPLSPGAPYRAAIYDQYFSGTSTDSWLKTINDNEHFFYLIGIGRTEITVRNEEICSLRESYLGLSDLHVFDLEGCD